MQIALANLYHQHGERDVLFSTLVLFTHLFLGTMESQPKKLLDQVRDAIRLKHYSYRTEQSYVGWVRRYILFHNKTHPKDMGGTEVEAFLTHLAVKENVAASTQNQALSALLFLYRYVLHQDLEYQLEAVRAKRSRYLPTVLTKCENHDDLYACAQSGWQRCSQSPGWLKRDRSYPIYQRSREPDRSPPHSNSPDRPSRAIDSGYKPAPLHPY
jgi:Phage integrase, N-terminal SAM-like domain